MALIDLPESPAPRITRFRLRDFGTTIEGGQGAPDQRRNTLGNRWSLTVAMPAMEIVQARLWSTRLTQGLEAGGVRFWVRQPDLPTGSPGAALVNGAGQSGKTLSVHGMAPSYVARIGQFFAIVTGERRYGHRITEPARVDLSGGATFFIEPALRAEPSDNDVIEVGKPFIEGQLADIPEEVINETPLTEGFQFTIREIR